ncbi:cytochrome P450 [Aspergillus heterothallicus]
MFMAAETLTHLFHLLSRHPRSLRTLHAEVAQRLPNSSLPTSGDLTPANMPYLSGCVKETLRLFPTVPFNNRIALHDTILPRGGGPDGSTPMVVPAGSELSLPHYPLYRRHDIFGADADEFIPERWIQDPFGEGVRKLLSQEDYERQCEGYLPFSIGKRACPGRGIALETVRNTAVRVLQEFSDIQDAARGWTEEGEFWGDVAE